MTKLMRRRITQFLGEGKRVFLPLCPPPGMRLIKAVFVKPDGRAYYLLGEQHKAEHWAGIYLKEMKDMAGKGHWVEVTSCD